jgi:hypothetical protein
MGLSPSKFVIHGIVDTVLDGIPDLIRMPPSPPQKPKASPVVGELSVKEGDRTLSQRDVTAEEMLTGELT